MGLFHSAGGEVAAGVMCLGTKRFPRPSAEWGGWVAFGDWSLQVNCVKSRVRPNSLSLEFAIHNLCGLHKVLPSLLLSFLICKMRLNRQSQKMNTQVPGML